MGGLRRERQMGQVSSLRSCSSISTASSSRATMSLDVRQQCDRNSNALGHRGSAMILICTECTLPALSRPHSTCDHVGPRQHVWTPALRGPTPTMPTQPLAGTCGGQETRAQLHLSSTLHRAQLTQPLLSGRRAVVQTSRSGCWRCSCASSRHPHGAGLSANCAQSTAAAEDLHSYS